MTGHAERGPVIILAPLMPADTGNGLAMRAGMFVEALGGFRPVVVVVIPIAGPADDPEWVSGQASRVVTIAPVSAPEQRAHVSAQLADPRLRERLAACAPLPHRSTLAPPTLARPTVAALGQIAPGSATVVGLRLPLIPLAVELGRALDAARIVVDLDDDDATLMRALGEVEEAEAHTRLANAWLPDLDAVTVASQLDAEGLAARHTLPELHVVPNVVRLPTSTTAPPGHDRMLFVGNLRYRPNVDAARWLACEILPAVQVMCPTATLDLVGGHDDRLHDLRAVPGVRLLGQVSDLTAAYDRGDVVVTPLRHGAGTRIKVLEAFAHRRPVVATATAVSGLGVIDGLHVLLAETTASIADSVVALLTHPARGSLLSSDARKLVESHFTLETTRGSIAAAVLGADSVPL